MAFKHIELTTSRTSSQGLQAHRANDFTHIEPRTSSTSSPAMDRNENCRDRASGRTATGWANKLPQGPLQGSSQALDHDEDQTPPQWNATSCTLRDPTRYKFAMFYVLHDVCRKCPGYCGPRQCTRYALQAFIIKKKTHTHKHTHTLISSRLLTCSNVHVHGGRQRRLPTLIQGLKNVHRHLFKYTR